MHELIENQTKLKKTPQKSQLLPPKPPVSEQNRNWYYYDNNGQRQGTISSQKLADLTAKGVITQQTRLETHDGHKGLAGQIEWLFPK